MPVHSFFQESTLPLDGLRQELAAEFQASGKLEDAAQAWEAKDGILFEHFRYSS